MSSGIVRATLVPPPPPAPPAPPESREHERVIQRQLSRTSFHVRLVDLASNLIVLVVGILLYLLAAALVDHWFVPLGWMGRAAALVFLVSASVWFFAAQIWPLLVRGINSTYAARTIEEATPTLKNSLINFLLLKRDHTGVREVVFQAVEAKAAADIVAVPVEAAVDRGRLIRAGYVLCGVMALFAAYKIFSPKDPFQTIARVAFPWADIARPSRVEISEVVPGNANVYHGQIVSISALISGTREEDAVTLYYSSADGQTIDEPVEMTLAPGGLKYVARLPKQPESNSQQQDTSRSHSGIQQDLTYRVVAGDAESHTYRLTVVAAPTIIVDRLDYAYPAYTRKAPESVAQQGDIHGLEGTRVTIHAVANQPMTSAWIEFDPDSAQRKNVPLKVEGTRAQGTITLHLDDARHGPWHARYQVAFIGQRGQRSQQPIVHQIEVIRDLGPEVQVLQPQQTRVQVPEDGSQTIEVRALDPDFGLSSVRIEGSAGEQKPLRVELLKREDDQPPQVTVPYSFVPQEHGFAAGDEVKFVAIAADNRTRPDDGRPDPSIARTSEYSLVIVPAARPGESRAGEPAAGTEAEAGVPSETATDKPVPQPGAAPQEGTNLAPMDSQAKPKPGERTETPPAGTPQNGQQNSGQQNSGQQQSGQQQSGQQQAGQQQSGQQQSGQQQSGQQQSGQPMSGQSQSGQGSASQSQGSTQTPDQVQGGSSQGNSSAGQAGKPQQGGPINDSPQPGSQSAGNSAGQSGSNNSQQSGNRGQESGDQSGQATGSENAGQRPGDSSDERSTGSDGDSQGGKPPKAHEGELIEEVIKRLEKEQGQDGQAGEAGKPSDAASHSPMASGQSSNESGKGGQPGEASGQPEPGEGQTPAGNQPEAGEPGAGSAKSPGGKSRLPEDRQGENSSQQPGGGNEGGKPQGPDNTEQGTQSSQSTGEQKQPGAGQNGDEGAGSKSADKTGSGSGQEANRDRPKSQQPSEASSTEGEPSPPSGSKRQSDSQGGQSGDQSGGGKKGAGQSAGQEGNDSAGSKSAADEGAGAAGETGSGETGSKAGSQKESAGKTGNSGTKSGDGSGSRAGPQGSEAGKAEGAPDGAGDKDKPQGDGSSPTAGRSAGGPVVNGGGDGNRPAQDYGPSPEAEAADAANLEYSRKATDLALQKLRDQEHNPDPELLDKMGWTKDDLAEFLRRWDALEKSASESADGKRELDEALRSLGLRDPALKKRVGGATNDNQRDLRDSGTRTSPPEKYRSLFDAFRKGAARSGE